MRLGNRLSASITLVCFSIYLLLLSGTAAALGMFRGLRPVVAALCWPYVLNSYLVFIGTTPSVTWWESSVLGFIPFLNRAAAPLALLTWILHQTI